MTNLRDKVRDVITEYEGDLNNPDNTTTTEDCVDNIMDVIKSVFDEELV